MGYARHGSLLQYIRTTSLVEGRVREIMEQLLLAIDLMHKKQIIHRDIKPDNILILKPDDEGI